VNVKLLACEDGPRVTLTSSETPVMVWVPAPRSASTVTLIRAVPGPTVSMEMALMPSSAGVTLRTVSSLEAQTGTPSTEAGSPRELVIVKTNVFETLVGVDVGHDYLRF
jgi:hypothetical protein